MLICTGLLQDAILAYGSLRVLADDLAAAGYPTLRFDYPATGDSSDEAVERVGHWTAWQRTVDEAADWLKARTGATRLVLVGLRLGTTLATLAAVRRDDVAGLLLFEPVPSGRAYVRQLFLEAELLSGSRPDKGQDLHLREFRFSPATLTEIGEIDLRKVVLKPNTRVALAAQTESKVVEDAATAWRAGGADVVSLGWDGLMPLVKHKIIEEDSLADFTTELAWLRGAVPPAPNDTIVHTDDAVLRLPGCVETPLRFGPDRRLFGVLCRPESGAAETAVLLGNAGHDPHYASARHAVTLSRKLARQGVAALRLDYASLGDSPGPAGKERMLSHVFAVDRTADVSAAIDALQAMGFRRFGIEGLCSGAFHAFRAGVADPRIGAVLVVNIPFFSMPGGNVLGFLQQKALSPADYIAKLFRPRTWVTLFSGKVDFRTVFFGQLGRLQNRLNQRASGLARRTGLVRERSYAHESLAALAKRGARILFLFSPGEEADGAFAHEFSPMAEGLAAYAGAAMKVVPGMDHDLTAPVARRAAEELMVEFFSRS
ncbi:MAG: hypothetical protein JSR24_05430 [Proteobacteria bacterium]|nr:hypothetical protein [Pseudomonadota bacterium]